MSQSDVKVIKEALIEKAESRDNLIATVGAVIKSTVEYVLDGEPSLDYLEAPELTYIGTKFEKSFLRELGLPRFTRFDKRERKAKGVKTLDTEVAGSNLDIKFTLRSNWMIPPEAVSEHCMLVRADYEKGKFSVGLLRMEEDCLTEGENRDKKRSVSKDGKSKIEWIALDADLEAQNSAETRYLDAMCSLVGNRLFSCSARAILQDAEKTSGIYAVFHHDEMVYLGSALDVRHRLREHRKTVGLATKINSDDITYRFAACDYHASLSIERKLISQHVPSWNSTGFGRRPRKDNRHQKPSAWDIEYGAVDRTTKTIPNQSVDGPGE